MHENAREVLNHSSFDALAQVGSIAIPFALICALNASLGYGIKSRTEACSSLLLPDAKQHVVS